MSYNAIIARIKVRPHQNADKLQIGTACGSDCVVGLDVVDGELGVFFPDDGQLSMEFLEKNNLLYRTDKNGKKVDGYFGSKRRVRAQAFRGVKSYGFWTRLESLYYTGQDIRCDEILEQNKDSTLDKKHMIEGVCVTWYHAGKCVTFKHKSFDFLLAEGIVKDDESTVDIEESA